MKIIFFQIRRYVTITTTSVQVVSLSLFQRRNYDVNVILMPGIP